VVLHRTGHRDGVEVTLTRWRIDGRELVEEAAVTLEDGRNLDFIDGTTLLVLEGPDRLVHVYDGHTLEPHPAPEFAGLDKQHYPRAAAGRQALAHWSPGPVTVVAVDPHPVYRLLEVPMGDLTAVDLGELNRALATGPADRPGRGLLAALRDRVQPRYADEFELAPGPPAPDGTDIALGS
jgi:hypothetical protein